MNYVRELDSNKGLKDVLKKILKDVDKRLDEIEAEEEEPQE